MNKTKEMMKGERMNITINSSKNSSELSKQHKKDAKSNGKGRKEVKFIEKKQRNDSRSSEPVEDSVDVLIKHQYGRGSSPRLDHQASNSRNNKIVSYQISDEKATAAIQLQSDQFMPQTDQN